MEFLLDKDELLYFMKVNFRASAWNPTGLHAGMPLAYLLGKGMENGFIAPAYREHFETFTSISEIIDYSKLIEGGICSLGECLKDFREAGCLYIYDKDNIGPWEEDCRNWNKFK